MRRSLEGLRRLVPMAVPVGLVAILLGAQLLALRSFSPTNMLYLYWPWAFEAPDDPGIETAGPFADNWDFLLPAHIQAAARLADGDLPLWSPFAAGGGDLLPNMGSMVLAPSTLLWMALPDWYVAGLVKALEILGAWGFLFLFLRRVGVSRGAAAIAGLAFATTGFQVVWFSWPQTVVSMFVAGTLWAWDRLRERPGDPLRFAVASLMVAATILEGFPAVAVVGMAAAGMVLVVRVLAEWPGWRSALQSAAAVAGSALLGLSLTMVTVLPFLHLLDVYQLDRALAPDFPARKVISTVLSPNSWGAADGFFGPFNYIELQGYLAPVALMLLVPGLVIAIATRRHLAMVLTALAVGSVLYLYSYGFEPLYDMLRRLPVLSSNAPTRAKAAGALALAVAVGLGLDVLLRGGASRRVRLLALGLTATSAAAACVFLVRVGQLAPPEHEQFVSGELRRAILMLVLAVALAALLVWRVTPSAVVRRVALLSILALMVLDATAWIRPYWPSSRPEDFYPDTTAHAFVQSEVGQQRLASEWVTYWGGTNAVYGFRTMQGHQFHRPAWREVIVAAGGRMATPTMSVFDKRESASSPVLDRFGVMLWADQPLGRRCATRPPEGAGSVLLESGMALDVGSGQRVRGLGIRLTAAVDQPAEIIVNAGGKQGVRHIDSGTKAGTVVYLPVPEVTAAGSSIAYRIESVTGGPVRVAIDGDGQPLVPCVRRADDGLRLEFAGGALVYRRLHALDRVRWADAAIVEADPARRLAALAAGGLAADTVLLDEGQGSASQGHGSITSMEDGDDALTATTSSSARGWLVIADPKQQSWRATVDGQPVPVVPAEHAGIAVEVPAGEHSVQVWYAPEGLRAGLIVTLLGWAVVLGLLVAGAVGRLRQRGSGTSTTAEGALH